MTQLTPCNFIIFELSKVALQTELLEACDWDEEKLENIMIIVTEQLHASNIKIYNSWYEIEQVLKQNLNNITTPKIFNIIMKVINYQKDELILYINSEEN